MSSSSKRSCKKIQEFAPHGTSPVLCLALGQKSARVLATGGDDRKVNLFKIGHPASILSLSGHTSAVECVSFDLQEECLLAGSSSGTIKHFNLEAGKVSRTCLGHKSNATCVTFHPYGDFFASGSMDTNLKIWDVRRKNCLQTYKGHKDGIRSLSFSPDGKWIVSGGDDGLVKVWDLSAGKLLHTFEDHHGPVNSMDFHPREFLLSTGSADRTIKFWDMDEMCLDVSTPPEATAISCVKFHPEGDTLLSASQDCLKVYGWEEEVDMCLDIVWSSWPRIHDLQLSSAEQAVAVGVSSQTYVQTWAVDLTRLQPFAEAFEAYSDDVSQEEPAKRPTSSKPRPLSSKQGRPTSSKHPRPLSSKAGSRGPARPTSSKRQPSRPSSGHAPAGRPQRSDFFSADPLPAVPPASVSSGQGQSGILEHFVAPPARYPSKRDERSSRVGARASTDPPPRNQAAVPSTFSEPVGLDISNFLTNNSKAKLAAEHRLEPAPGAPHQAPPDLQALEAMMEPSAKMAEVLHQRLTNLRIIRQRFNGSDASSAVDALAAVGDPAVTADVLKNVLNLRPAFYTLEVSAKTMPLLQELLSLSYADYLIPALESLSIILNAYGRMIRESHLNPSQDVSQEDRRERCRYCFNAFATLLPLVEGASAGPQSDVTRAASELLPLLHQCLAS